MNIAHKLTLAAALSLVMASASQAVVVAYDGFEGYVAGLDLAGNSGGTGWTSNWAGNSQVDVVAAALSYSNGAVTINGGARAVQINGALGTGSPLDNLINRSFAGQSGDLYMSLLFRPVSNGGATSDDFLTWVLNDDTDIENSGQLGMRNSPGTTGNDGYFGRIRNSSTDSTSVEAGILSVANRTDLVVAKFSKVASANYNTLDIFINPSTLSEPAPSASVTFDSANSLVDFFTMRVAFIDAGNTYQFDELRIATTYLESLGGIPIPEPAGALLGMLGAAALALRRRAAR
jgi:hypothetical protein